MANRPPIRDNDGRTILPLARGAVLDAATGQHTRVVLARDPAGRLRLYPVSMATLVVHVTLVDGRAVTLTVPNYPTPGPATEVIDKMVAEIQSGLSEGSELESVEWEILQ